MCAMVKPSKRDLSERLEISFSSLGRWTALRELDRWRPIAEIVPVLNALV